MSLPRITFSFLSGGVKLAVISNKEAIDRGQRAQFGEGTAMARCAEEVRGKRAWRADFLPPRIPWTPYLIQGVSKCDCADHCAAERDTATERRENKRGRESIQEKGCVPFSSSMAGTRTFWEANA